MKSVRKCAAPRRQLIALQPLLRRNFVIREGDWLYFLNLTLEMLD